ncbi:MAG TPA: hypothetical protein VE631_02930 [Alphaproteobacteria bacterium]|nr:hypothetical protein [Alphaproteobacteria bacterium]
MRFTPVRVVAVALFALCAALPAGAAEKGGEKDAPTLTGVLEATPYDVIPPDARFVVRPRSGSPAAKTMAQVLEKAISDAGRPTGGSNAYLVQFELSSGVPRTDGGPDIQLRGEGGSAHVGDDVGVVMQWRLRRNGSGANAARRMLLTVTDPAAHVVWEGHADVTAPGMDDVAVMSRIAPALATSLGESVAGRTLP